MQFKAVDPSQPIETVTRDAEGRPTIERAVELFVSDKRSQGVSAEVLGKYERELQRWTSWRSGSKFFPHEIGLSDRTEFRAGWEGFCPWSMTRSKVQERLRSFLRYCLASKLIDRAPQLSAVQVTTPPTMPLTEEQHASLSAASLSEFAPVKAARVYAFIQLMRP